MVHYYVKDTLNANISLEFLQTDGKLIKKFSGNSGGTLHQKNFLEAVRKRDRSILNTDVQVGHDSTGWCNLANIAYRTGKAFTMDATAKVDVKEWTSLVDEMKQLMGAYSLTLENADLKLGPMLTIDPKTEKFVGSDSEEANKFLKREYRAPFVVPDVV